MLAFRIRASMSATGSVMRYRTSPSSLPAGPHRPPGSPARLAHARDVSLVRQLPEAEPAERKLAEVAARPPAAPAPVALPRAELRTLLHPRQIHLGGQFPTSSRRVAAASRYPAGPPPWPA